MADNDAEDGKKKMSLGQAIDALTEALGGFEGGDQQTILRAVYEHLKISGPTPVTAAPPAAKPAEAPVAAEPAGAGKRTGTGEFAGMDIRTFKELKSPTSARQMACVVAYYLSEVVEGDEKTDVVSTAVLDKYFKQAKFPMPNKLEQVLPDAKSGGYFETVGRGEYKLTRVGYNLVAHQLPPKATKG